MIHFYVGALMCSMSLRQVVKEATEAFLSTGAGDAWRNLAQQRLVDLTQTPLNDETFRSKMYRKTMKNTLEFRWKSLKFRWNFDEFRRRSEAVGCQVDRGLRESIALGGPERLEGEWPPRKRQVRQRNEGEKA